MSEPPTKVTKELLKLQQDDTIELFVLDATDLGGAVHRFHGYDVPGSGQITFDGEVYDAIAMQAKGFGFSGDDQPAEPTIKIASISGTIPSLLAQYDDLIGATVTRIRTLRKHLADGSDPDGTARLSDDIYFVNRKASENRIHWETELGSSLDVEGKQLPGRRCLGRCQFRFKDGDNCPYVGPETTCAKTVAACEAYFGAGNPLPFGGFPTADRVPNTL